MALSSVLQTIPTSTRTVGTVEDRHGQNRGTTMGLKDTKTSVSEDIEDKGNILTRAEEFHTTIFQLQCIS